MTTCILRDEHIEQHHAYQSNGHSKITQCLSCLQRCTEDIHSINIDSNIFKSVLTARPKKLLRRNRFNATDMKHVPSRIINESNALLGKSLSSLEMNV